MDYGQDDFFNLSAIGFGTSSTTIDVRNLGNEILSLDLLLNPFTVFGFLWGIPVPAFFLYFHRSLTGETVLTILSTYEIHWFFLAHPLLFAIFFGIVGQLYLDYHSELKYRATHDELTKLLNHSEFHKLGRNYISDRNRDRDSAGLMLLDLDHFKKVNDSMGHQKGDDVLKYVSRQLRSTTREGDLVCRFGGEEFAVLLPNTNSAQAHDIAERIRRTIAADDRNIPDWLTLSAGVASYPEDGSTLDELITVADERLYEAKSEGRNRTF
jgi:diguanylate cyclase (GGDEF)-like protein